MFKFLHAADIHLDSPLRGLERYEGAPVEAIRGATRRALENLVDLALAEQAAFVLVAGDLYDGDWQDHRTGLFFVAQMARLRDAGIRVYLIAGNHDAANRMTKTLRLPDNVRQLSTNQPQTVALDEWGTLIHGQGFARAACSDNLAASYPAADRACFNIGLLHTSATGRSGHEPYAPCTVECLRGRGYDYWALGHVHQRETLCQDPPVHFPGNIQGRHVRETGAKGCLVVSVDGNRRPSARFEALDVLRWQQLTVDASGVDDCYEVVERFEAELGRTLAASDGRPLALRVAICGACRVHGKLGAQPDRWTQEIRAASASAGAGRVWIERVLMATTPQRLVKPATDGPMAELLQYIELVRDNPDAMTDLAGELDELVRKLPAELRSGPAALDPANPDLLAEAIVQAESLLVHRLLEVGEGA